MNKSLIESSELQVVRKLDVTREFRLVNKREYINTDINNLEYQELRFTGINECCNICIKHVKYNNGKRILNSNLVFPVYINYVLSIANFAATCIRTYREFNKLEYALLQLEKDKNDEYKLSNIGTISVIRERVSYYLCLNITSVGLFKFSLDSNVTAIVENEQYVNDTLHNLNQSAADLYFSLLEDCLVSYLGYMNKITMDETCTLKNINSIDLLITKYLKDEGHVKLSKKDTAKQ